MFTRGVAACGALLVATLVCLSLGAQATGAANQPAGKKAVIARRHVHPSHAKPRQVAASSAMASEGAPTASLPQESAATQPASSEPSDIPSAPAPAKEQDRPAVTPPAPTHEAPAAETPAGEPTETAAATPQKITLGQATVLGVVEGLTEYLPVSSTGHLILAGYWMGLTRQTQEPGAFGGHKLEKAPAIDAYEIVIQLGAILAVVGLYRKRVGQMVQGLMGRNPQGLHLAILVLAAFLPAAVIGLAVHKKIEEHLFGPMPVALALAVGGVLMIVVEHYFWTRRKDRMHEAQQTRTLVPVGTGREGSTGPMINPNLGKRPSSPFLRLDALVLWQAVAIGFAQCLSLWPGTSRSMVTIVAGLVVGLDMVAAAEFSFLLALPTLGAATLYSLAKHHHELMASAGAGGLLVGLIVSGIVAAIAVKAFVHYLTRRGLVPFGIYRIVLALILMLYFLR
jgi:undecaprenyl-diphosphatase